MSRPPPSSPSSAIPTTSRSTPAGNQLPYIDKLQISVNGDVQTLVLKVVNGEIDYQDRHIDANSNRAVFIDSAAERRLPAGRREQLGHEHGDHLAQPDP